MSSKTNKIRNRVNQLVNRFGEQLILNDYWAADKTAIGLSNTKSE